MAVPEVTAPKVIAPNETINHATIAGITTASATSAKGRRATYAHNNFNSVNEAQLNKLSRRIRLVRETEMYRRITDYRQREYALRYPQVEAGEADAFDERALIFYSTDKSGSITSTARLVFDSPHGLPDEEYFRLRLHQLRRNHQKTVELGRFIITDQGSGLAKDYYRIFYFLSRQLGIDNILMLMRQKEVKFHTRRVGATVLNFNTGVNFGSKHGFAAVDWVLYNTPEKFLNWLNKDASSQEVSHHE